MNSKPNTEKRIGYQDPLLEIKADVFKENVYGTIARLFDIAKKMGVNIKNDKEHFLVKVYQELLNMLDNVYKFNTVEEVDKADDRLIEIQKYCASL